MNILGCLKSSTKHQLIGFHLQNIPRYHCKHQFLHTTASCFAVPLPHLTAPGPPPSPPDHEPSNVNNSLSLRKRRAAQSTQRDTAKEGLGKSSGLLHNRFWKDVNIYVGEGM